MAFDFSYSDTRDNLVQVEEKPLVKIWNNKDKRSGDMARNSYFFLNKAATALLGNAKRVRVGIDVETKKIVISPSKNDLGRQLSRQKSGSATVSVTHLIEDNNLPSKTCVASYLSNYIHGGLIFNYKEDEPTENP